MNSLQSHTSTGTKSIISGKFSLLSRYDDLLDNLDEYITKALNTVTEEESLSFKNRLNETPDWKHTQEQAKVSVSLTNVSFSVDHADAPDLEYGNPLTKRAASGLIRSQTKRRSGEIGTNLVNRVLEEAFGA